MMANNIRYLYNAQTGIELIFCKDWAVSYPLHNHVSVLTIGIILDGSLVLTTNKVCIDKNAVNDIDVITIQKRIGLLLMQALNMGKINQYQLLQLLNCLNETSDSSNWQFKNHTPYIHDLKNSWNYTQNANFLSRKWRKTFF